MNLVYLDYNCFQRGFDDPRQIRIQLEALACEEIFALSGKTVRLVWSFMHDDENLLCPFVERKLAVHALRKLCQVLVPPLPEIAALAHRYQNSARLSAKDALHLACAVQIGAEYFLTCDDQLLKRTSRLNLNLTVANPVDFIRKV